MYKTDPTKGATRELRTQSPNAVETKRNAEPHSEFGKKSGKRTDALREDRIGAERSRFDAAERNRSGVGDYPTDRNEFRRHDGGQTVLDDHFKAHSTPAPAMDARKSLSKRLLHATEFKHGRTSDGDRIETAEKRYRNANHSPPKEKRRSVVEEESHHRKQTIWCGNNILDPRLSRNGGPLRIGSRSECFRRGVGGGLHQKVERENMHQFLTTWTSPYRKHIEQPMHYGDGPVPEGKIRATLGQCLSRGFADGSIQKAKKIMKHRHEAGAHK